MLTKLAFKNVGKSFRDYAIYFFTLMLAVCVFYMFNSIYAQQEIMAVTMTQNQSMKSLQEILSVISVFVAVILGFLIVYANNFFIKRRKKELGIYMTLGMNKGMISTILILETSVLAIIALIVGLFLGVLGSQFMSIFTAKIFEADMTNFRFVFAPAAAFKSIIYFGIIFAIVIIFNTVVISKFKLIDLIYGGRKNETLRIKSLKVSVAIFIAAIICLITAYILILKNGFINVNIFWWSSIILGTIGTILFFLSSSGILTEIIKSNKKLYFKNLNIFVFRQLNSKINTNFVSISVVCITLLLVIGIFSCGYSMQNILSKDLINNVKYDFTLVKHADNEVAVFDKLPENIKSYNGIKNYEEYTVYISKKSVNFKDFDVDLSGFLYDISDNSIYLIKLSDCNKILQLYGENPIQLLQNEYGISGVNDSFLKIGQELIDKNYQLTLGNSQLSPNKEIKNVMTSNNVSADGELIFIVNDDDVLSDDLLPVSNILNLNCKDEKSAIEFELMLKAYSNKASEASDWDNMAYSYLNSRSEIYEFSVGTKAIISFLAIYLGIVFMITCAAILAIQQLSEASDNKDRYALLKNLGTDKKMLNKALFTQIACYFLFPLILAIVHSIVGLTAANVVIKSFGRIDITASIIATAVFMIIVYGAYFILTYIGSKNIINKN